MLGFVVGGSDSEVETASYVVVVWFWFVFFCSSVAS